ncbi:hypothetical protein [Umezawaea tangerina]|uniref:Uncharacterized protein n=1 Tax=Umezawaea tangerina TaxID=84725 RepID=A0A2T0SWL0_9PSEU|nr:hypothetical protein [Umezawaea tangerina]PRY37789.1 hypothetical protein CLV43_1099 [Umezawaea tangerina]
MTTIPANPTANTSVQADYRHYPKEALALPASDLVLPVGHLKWYEVREAEAVIPDATREQAHAFLLDEVASGGLAVADDIGFVIHHLCGESFYFLIVSSWRNNNEMWQTLYYKDGDAPLARFTDGPHRSINCVWEMGIVMHEQQRWSRFLYSARDEAALAAYLDDRFTGTV